MDWLGFLKAPFVRLKAAEVPLDPSRRAFIKGAAAVVAAASIMPVRVPALVLSDAPVAVWLDGQLLNSAELQAELRAANELGDVIRRAFVPRLNAQLYQQSPLLQALWDHTELVASTPRRGF